MLQADLESLIQTVLGSSKLFFLQVMVPSFCDPLFRRQQELDEEKRAVFQYKTGTL